MKWDYHTYLEQPDWFIEGLRLKINYDNREKNKQQKKLSKKYG